MQTAENALIQSLEHHCAVNRVGQSNEPPVILSSSDDVTSAKPGKPLVHLMFSVQSTRNLWMSSLNRSKLQKNDKHDSGLLGHGRRRNVSSLHCGKLARQVLSVYSCARERVYISNRSLLSHKCRILKKSHVECKAKTRTRYPECMHFLFLHWDSTSFWLINIYCFLKPGAALLLQTCETHEQVVGSRLVFRCKKFQRH